MSTKSSNVKSNLSSHIKRNSSNFIRHYSSHKKKNELKDNEVLAVAIMEGQLDVVKYILEHHLKNFDINKEWFSCYGSTPLLMATEKNQLNIIKFLIENFDVDINKPFSNSGATALLMAVENKNIAIASYLVERGAKINLVDKQGVSPLMRAFLQNDLEIFRHLLKEGLKEGLKFDIDVAFVMAVEQGRYEFANYLVDKMTRDIVKDAYKILDAFDKSGKNSTQWRELGEAFLKYAYREEPTLNSSTTTTTTTASEDSTFPKNVGGKSSFFYDPRFIKKKLTSEVQDWQNPKYQKKDEDNHGFGL